MRLLDKYSPVRAPDGVDGIEPAATIPEPAESTVIDHGDTDPVESPKIMTVREAIEAARDEHAEPADPAPAATPAKARDKTGRFAPDGKDAAPKPEGSTSKPAATPASGQQPAPTAWSKEEKAVWDSLPPIARQAIARRETDTAKGVEKIKSQYQELDAAVAPHRPMLKQVGLSEGALVGNLLNWMMALHGPDKVRAAGDLLRSVGIDPATTFAGADVVPAGASPTSQQYPPELQNLLGHLTQKIGSYDQYFASQTQGVANQAVHNWAGDKPHFEAVRNTMAELIRSGVVPPKADGSVNLDGAYEMAVYGNPETRALLLQEQQAKQAAANRQAVTQARKAGSGLRPGAPGAPQVAKAPVTPKGETVRDSIRRALAEARA